MSYLLVPSAKAILLPADRGLLTPSAKWVEVSGKRYVAVRHDLENTIALRANGILVPSPIAHYYDWPKIAGLHEPRAHQRDTAAFATLHPRNYILNDIGTGKTHSALWATDYLMNLGQVEKTLIVAPLSTLKLVWRAALFDTFGHRKCEVLYGSAARRRKLLDRDADFYIINHDGFRVCAGQLAARKDINHVILDELAVYRNIGTTRNKDIRRYIRPSQSVWGMTGSPRPNFPTDVYGQIKIVTPQRLGNESLRMFKFRTMEQQSMWVWTEKKEANKVIAEYMRPAIRFSRDECLDLPKMTYSSREAPMTKEQDKAYRQMAKELQAEVKAGIITAANAGVKASKLLQIAGGAVFGKDRKVHYLPCQPRLNELIDLREQTASGKFIIFASFRPHVELITEFLTTRYGGASVAKVHGDVPMGARERIFGSFQAEQKIQWLVADPGTMSHGLTLTEAGTILWWGPEASNEVYTQANGRITRISQFHIANVVHLSSTPAERKGFKNCGVRGLNQSDYLDLIEEAASY